MCVAWIRGGKDSFLCLIYNILWVIFVLDQVNRLLISEILVIYEQFLHYLLSVTFNLTEVLNQKKFPGGVFIYDAFSSNCSWVSENSVDHEILPQNLFRK